MNRNGDAPERDELAAATLRALSSATETLHAINDTDAMIAERLENWDAANRHAAARLIANVLRETSLMLFQLSGYIQ